ncbi:hypothetical protein ACLOJK_013137 [Asimina triloba]
MRGSWVFLRRLSTGTERRAGIRHADHRKIRFAVPPKYGNATAQARQPESDGKRIPARVASGRYS